MGLWSWVKDKAKKAGNAIKKGVKKVANFVEGVYEGSKEVATNVYAKFSGKDKADEAKRRWEALQEKYERKQKKYQKDVDEYGSSIKKHVDSINASKAKIKRELFPQMADKLSRLADINVSEDFAMEDYKLGEFKLGELRSKDEVIKIDFQEHKFSSHCQAIFTLGFLSRKKAKESLMNVQEEEKAAELEFKKMNAEISRIKAIDLALSNVDDYFTSLIEIYELLLARLDNSINFLYVRCMSLAHKLVRSEMSVKVLPKVQQKEFQAIMTATKILKEMVDTNVTDVNNDKEINSYSSELKEKKNEIVDAYKAA